MRTRNTLTAELEQLGMGVGAVGQEPCLMQSRSASRAAMSGLVSKLPRAREDRRRGTAPPPVRGHRRHHDRLVQRCACLPDGRHSSSAVRLSHPPRPTPAVQGTDHLGTNRTRSPRAPVRDAPPPHCLSPPAHRGPNREPAPADPPGRDHRDPRWQRTHHEDPASTRSALITSPKPATGKSGKPHHADHAKHLWPAKNTASAIRRRHTCNKHAHSQRS